VRSFTRFKQVGSGENNRKIGTGHKGRRCICESRKAASVSDTSSKAEEGRSLAGSARPLLTTHRWQLFVHGYAMISSQVPVIGICGNAFEWNSWFRVAEWLLVLCQGEFDVWLVRPVRDWDMPLYTHEVSMASSRIPAGILPSLRAFSRRVISARVFAFLIRSSIRFLSLSVNLTREILSVPLASAVEAVLSDLDEREERSFWASSVGSATVPKSSVALERSASLTFWKSRNLTEGHVEINQ
jgi:hypothetical protein